MNTHTHTRARARARDNEEKKNVSCQMFSSLRQKDIKKRD